MSPRELRRAVQASGAARASSPGGGMIPYGKNWPGLDSWCDVDGTIYVGRGPFERRPLRLLRRKVGHWARGWSR